jgi:hypothetical protein
MNLRQQLIQDFGASPVHYMQHFFKLHIHIIPLQKPEIPHHLPRAVKNWKKLIRILSEGTATNTYTVW